MTPPPSLLLAEDDPISRAFLHEVLASAGYQLTTVEDGCAALRAARQQRFELLLLDLNLPGLNGGELLAQLHEDCAAQSRHSPALALTADTDPGLHRHLRDCGFAEVLGKPVGVSRLLLTVNAHLAGPVAVEAGSGLAVPPTRSIQPDETLPELPVWDHAIALAAANGSAEIVAALRPLMLQELPRQRAIILAALAQGDPGPARAELHRLRAACGFCGTRQLAAAVDALAEALTGTEDCSAERRLFEQASTRLLSTPPPAD